MRRTPLVAAIALSLSLPSAAFAQAAGAGDDRIGDTPASNTIPVTYTGANTRLSIGIDDDANVLGEILAVFGKQDDSAWLFEGWVGHGGEGGVKLDYHWVWGRDGANSSDGGRNATVAKVFGAVDQNAWDDRKATLGVGFERNDLFLDVYASGAITDERLVGTGVDTSVTTITGTENGRPFEQTQTTVVTTRSFEHPYDWGLGARVGRHFDASLVRLRGGLDYEKGDFDSSQLTFSLGLDKYIRNTGHSFTAELEHYERDGDFEIDDSDTRAWLLYRYDFGNSYSPAPGAYREVERPREVTVEVPAEPRIVRNEVRMDTESFFEFDRSELKPSAQAALEELVATIKSEKRVSRVAVVGSTCDLGPTDYNQALSERRAASVRAFFESRGIETTELDVKGVGETEPKYPNDSEENRRKNRRVDVSFLTVETTEEPGEALVETRTEVEWVREPVDAPPAFIERALRNPSEHKRTVDVYRFDEVDSETTLGPRTFLNRPPVAVDDNAGATCAAPIVVPVLANDSDPDGDTLRVTAVTSDNPGTQAVINANNTITVQIIRSPGNIALCNDGGAFNLTYTIADPSGATDTGNVRVTVAAEPFDAQDDTATTPESTPVVINVIANDTLTPGSLVGAVSTPANGTAVANSDGRITYTPRPGFTGVDTFTYTVNSPQGRTDTATVRVTVTAGPNPTNRPPIAVDDFIDTLSDVDTNINVLRNDSDPDGDAITIVSYTQPANGTVVLTSTPGVFRYRSNSGFCGLDTFTYTIRDAAGNTATATVTVNVLD